MLKQCTVTDFSGLWPELDLRSCHVGSAVGKMALSQITPFPWTILIPPTVPHSLGDPPHPSIRKSLH
jgi:hypothetical protein